jgi:hypothetical protein
LSATGLVGGKRIAGSRREGEHRGDDDNGNPTQQMVLSATNVFKEADTPLCGLATPESIAAPDREEGALRQEQSVDRANHRD